MKDYALLRKYCAWKQMSRIETLQAWSYAILRDAPEDVVYWQHLDDGGPPSTVCFDRLPSHERDAISATPLPTFGIDTNFERVPGRPDGSDIHEFAEWFKQEAQICRDKIQPTRVSRAVKIAQDMIREGEALLRVEEREVEACIARLYALDNQKTGYEQMAKNRQQQEDMRRLVELKRQIAELEAQMKGRHV